MNGLRRLTEHADTFVVTCNIDGHFARAGFDENRVLETEGGIRTSIDERRLAHPDALATAQLEELERLCKPIATAGSPSSNLAWDCATAS